MRKRTRVEAGGPETRIAAMPVRTLPSQTLPSQTLPSRASALPVAPASGPAHRRRPLAVATAALALAASLAGCQALGGALGGGGGVMPATEVGPPPSLRSGLPGREARSANVDADGRPLDTAPTRRLDLPKDKRNEARTADDGPRRIRRDEIEGGSGTGSGSSSMGPALTPGGSVGLGGKF